MSKEDVAAQIEAAFEDTPSRQHRVGPYICDFACLEANLVVEVDGSQHGDQVDYDRRRDAYLFECGFHVLRFTNVEGLHQTDDVLATLHAFLTKP